MSWLVMRFAGLVSLFLGVAAPRALAQCPDGTPPPCRRPTAARARPDSTAVAVLYLSNRSSDTADAVIADGLTEEIIARLSQMPGIRASSRHASLRYRNVAAANVRQVGRELNVRYVIDGTLRRTGEQLRVVLSMTNAETGFNAWGRTYQRSMADIFSIPDSVAVQVAQVMLGRVGPAPLAPPAPPTSVAAYQAFLRGQVAVRARSAAGASAAIIQYQEAIRLDPRFARAWAALAHAAELAWEWGWTLDALPSEAVRPLVQHAAAAALALDSTSAETLLAAAMAGRIAADLSAAPIVALHRRAAAADSTTVETVHQLAWAFMRAGQVDSAIVYERAAITRDPYYAYAYAGLAEILNVAGRPADALEVIAEGLAVNAGLAQLYWHRAEAELRLRRPREALTALERAEQLGVERLGALVLRQMITLEQGDTAAVRAALPALREAAAASPARNGRAFSFVAPLAALYAQLGDAGESVYWIRQADHRIAVIVAVTFSRHWYFERVRAEPVFRELLAGLVSEGR